MKKMIVMSCMAIIYVLALVNVCAYVDVTRDAENYDAYLIALGEDYDASEENLVMGMYAMMYGKSYVDNGVDWTAICHEATTDHNRYVSKYFMASLRYEGIDIDRPYLYHVMPMILRAAEMAAPNDNTVQPFEAVYGSDWA